MNKKYLFIPIVGLLLFFVGINLSDAVKPSDHGLKEGDLISATDDPDVYIVNEHGYKRLFLNPQIFRFYGHLGGFENVKTVTAETRDAFKTSGLFRNCEDGDEMVFGVQVTEEDEGALHWINMSGDDVVEEEPDFFLKVFCINKNEFKWYKKGNPFTSLIDIPDYARADKEHKIIACHKPETEAKTIEVSIAAWKAHEKHGDILGPCSGTPTPTPTPDITPPIISDITVFNITLNAASISWVTNENSDSIVDYGTSSGSYGFSETGSTVASGSNTFWHTVGLTGLGVSSSYYFIVSSTDPNSNTATSSEQTFTTSILP